MKNRKLGTILLTKTRADSSLGPWQSYSQQTSFLWAWWGGRDRDGVPANSEHCHCEHQDYAHLFFHISTIKTLKVLHNNLMKRPFAWSTSTERRPCPSPQLQGTAYGSTRKQKAWLPSLHQQLILVCSVWCSWQAIHLMSRENVHRKLRSPTLEFQEGNHITRPAQLHSQHKTLLVEDPSS